MTIETREAAETRAEQWLVGLVAPAGEPAVAAHIAARAEAELNAAETRARQRHQEATECARRIVDAAEADLAITAAAYSSAYANAVAAGWTPHKLEFLFGHGKPSRIGRRFGTSVSNNSSKGERG